ncbi:MAG: chromosomal replication initiator protein DnaA [Isosphaeraceae bacterium]
MDEGAGDGAMVAHPGQVHDGVPGSTATADHLALESALRAAVAERLGELRFSLWFGEDVHLGLSGDGNALEVQVPNAFFREWIRGHFSANLVEAAQAVTGRQVRLSFAVQNETDPALGDVVDPDSDRSQQRSGSTVTVPIPGNPKAPLSFPTPHPASPDRSPTPRFKPPATDRIQSQNHAEHAVNGQASRPGLPGVPAAVRSPRLLDDFVTGPSNQLAHAASREMIHTAGKAFNPLVIHGGVGLGKTHLLEAISQGLRVVHPGLNVLSITAEAFTNSFLESMRAGTLGGFRTRYRRLGALAVDDVHFLAGTRATQNEFLHTFNSLIDHGAPIILTADQHPRRISRLTEELVTRFLGGMVVKLELPDLATRRAILQARSEGRGVSVPDTVLDYIAEHLRSSVRELEGAIHSVIVHALLTGKRLDMVLAKAALRDTIHHTAQAVGLRDVERAVCQLFQIDPEALKSDSRARALAYPRMLAMYLARKHTGAAYSEIGRHFGNRNHSTVISADKKVQGWLRDEQQNALLPGFETIADVLADLERTLGA